MSTTFSITAGNLSAPESHLFLTLPYGAASTPFSDLRGKEVEGNESSGARGAAHGCGSTPGDDAGGGSAGGGGDLAEPGVRHADAGGQRHHGGQVRRGPWQGR